MSEQENDGFYWAPTREDDLRQGDLLFNVPIALMPQHPRFVLGTGDEVLIETFDDYPEHYPDEREANAFAAALLMDERWLREDWASGLRSVASLAKRYWVSREAMSFRLVNLGLSQ